MKNKIILITIIIGMLFTATACGSNSNENLTTANVQKEEKIETKTEEAPKRKIEEVAEKGPGTMYLNNASGDTKDSTPITIFATEDVVYMQVGLETRDFDGKHKAFVYVDGNLNKEDQFGDYQGSIELREKELEKGEHQVIVKQYDDNTERGEVITVKEARYVVE